jgi:hypothetical protein
MNFLKLGARIISKGSFLLLVAGGIAIALASLSDRRRLRSDAVKVTKGALITKEQVKNAAAKMAAEASDIVKQARQAGTNSCSGTSAAKSFQATSKEKGHHIAVATTAKILTLKEKAQAEFKSIINEAKERRAIRKRS